VPKAEPLFTPWPGGPVNDTYGGKLVLELDGKAVLAELAILRILQEDGWSGVWVDTYGKKYRTVYWPKNREELPPEQRQLLQRNNEGAGSNEGCWDVFCWREEEHLVAESKRHGHDRIRDTQRLWLQAALECNVPLSSFLIVEWSVRGELRRK